MIVEFGGPRSTYEEFLRAVARQAGLAPPTDSKNPACRLACTRMASNVPGPLLTRIKRN